MTQKEINELRARVYSISNCMFPLDTFLNDIEQNKNQNYNKESAYNDLKLITDAIYELKEKLKDKEQDYTLEQVQKMWEEAGYEWVKKYLIHIKLPLAKDEDIYNEIAINPKTKAYFKRYGFIISREHDLIIKTIKALEKEEK